jgi:hypothetical protein
MIIRRITEQLRAHDWETVVVELLLVVTAIFLGLQVSNWNEGRKELAEGYYLLDLLHRQLVDKIRVDEEEIVSLTQRSTQIEHFAKLLHAESWTEEEFQRFKDQHRATYHTFNQMQRPSALKQLIELGKSDRVRSRQMQERLYELDADYEAAIQQTQISNQLVTEAGLVIVMEMPYGTREDLYAIPVLPDVLLKNRELKSAWRLVSTMNRIQLDELIRLQESRREMRDDLITYLSDHSNPVFEREQPD